MIAIIDCGLGNVRSIYAKIDQMGGKVYISSDPGEITKADKLILPGVGYFSQGMQNLENLHLSDIIISRVKEGVPILGICLGMQLLTDQSEEGDYHGLSLIDAKTIKITPDEGEDIRLPHMGWNTAAFAKSSPLLSGIADNPRFYFVHSYRVVCHHDGDVLALTRYGTAFPSMIQNGNIFGVQFHPEKSHKQGLQILKNFMSI